MKNDTQKHSRLRRYGRLNTSHFLLLGAEGGGGGLFVVLYGTYASRITRVLHVSCVQTGSKRGDLKHCHSTYHSLYSYVMMPI